MPRLHELCGLLARALVPFRGTLGGGLLLTGGGADVKGITDYFQANAWQRPGGARQADPCRRR